MNSFRGPYLDLHRQEICYSKKICCIPPMSLGCCGMTTLKFGSYFQAGFRCFANLRKFYSWVKKRYQPTVEDWIQEPDSNSVGLAGAGVWALREHFVTGAAFE